MSEKEKELDAALNKVQTLLNDLPTDYPIERLEELEKNLSSKLALVQLHRDWQQGSLEGIQHQNIRSRMRKYFGYAYPHKRKTKSESAAKRETKKDGQIREELKKHGIRPQLLNSVSYKLENINKLKLEFVEKAPFEELATKFLESRWNAEFQETANSIMKDPHYETEELLEEHPHTGSRITVSSLTGNLKPVQLVAVSDLENNRADGQAKVPTAESTVGYLQENHSGIARVFVDRRIEGLILTPDVGHFTVAPSVTQEPLGDIQPLNASDPTNVPEQPRLLPSGQSPNRTFENRNSNEMGYLIAQQTFAQNLQTTTFQSGNDSIVNVNMSEMMDLELGWGSWLGNIIIDSS
ncbi:hypothetical protein ACJA88_014823 [Fusarium oxysporum]